MTESPNIARAGDWALFLSPDEKRYLIRLAPGAQLHTHRGYVNHDAIIGQPFGSAIQSSLGHVFLLTHPSTTDWVMRVKRASQIIYPKEIGPIILSLNIVPGARVVEAGTGSGGLTLALARLVRPDGRIYSYEERADMQDLARKNLERAGALAVVELKLRDIRAGFDERGVDSLFLDVREPWFYLAQAHSALKGGGFFGALVPTTNQISALLEEMETHGGWAEIEVMEILQRYYKPNAERLRPVDRMVAHTGYLLFARAIARKTRAESGAPETGSADESE